MTKRLTADSGVIARQKPGFYRLSCRDMTRTSFSSACTLGALFASLLMSWRDISTRQVLDRELACFTLLTALPRALNPHTSVPGTSLPLWAVQVTELLRTTGGALLLLSVALPARLAAGRDLLGAGDILFALAAGFMLPAGASLHMVCLAFLLALPFSLARALGQKKAVDLPFIPFLTVSAFVIRWLSPPWPFF